MSDLWYKDAIIYSLDVECFRDSDADGVGDFEGLISELDYLVELGVTCLWLLPFYPTPNRDDGYDVSEYYNVDPRTGSLGDFAAFIREARARGLRVLIDLVVNHSSSDHAWFQAARRDPSSRFRDYYIWVDEPPERERRGGLVFPGEQSANWTYDAEAGAYYWHWFYEHQPDLNTGNPEVRAEIKKIMGFWLQLGVSGFRLDAAPFLFKRKGLSGAHPGDPQGFLLELRDFLNEQNPEAVFLAEADVESEELSFFLGEGERMHLVFNFILNNYLFAALAQSSADPLRRALEVLPSRPAVCQWANFVRNHDELNLDRLTESDRALAFDKFAPDPSMRIYGRGIRRRLAPMLGGDRRHIELVYSLVFSLPGTPVLRYGDEIGMGEDLSLQGRMSVRTPMQWSDAPNAGFSEAPPEQLVRPVIDEGEYGYGRVNVERQRSDPASLLYFMKRLIAARRSCPALSDGDMILLETGDPSVFAHRCESEGHVAVVIHNLSPEARRITLPLDESEISELTEIWADEAYPPLGGPAPEVEIRGYGYRWLRGGRAG